jgi:hypothetical protein
MRLLHRPLTSRTQLLGEARQHVNSAFEWVTLVLAVVAIIFAVVQFLDSRRQLDSIMGVAKHIQTQYVGSFPDNMDEIMKVVQNVSDGGDLDIMTDFAGYGLYSRNALYQQYLAALHAALNTKNAHERILVYSKALAQAALEKQFTEAKYAEEARGQFRHFFDHRPPVPTSRSEFVSRLLDELNHSVEEMCHDGIPVRRVPQSHKYLFFLWANHRPQGLFAFRNESETYRELSFSTVDPSLIDVFQLLFNDTWRAVDPTRPGNEDLWKETDGACQLLAKAKTS